MEFEEAKTLLNTATRWELRDHAFGDCEFAWVLDEEEIASGYSGSGQCDVYFVANPVGSTGVCFSGEEARELKKCGKETHISRNDETGPAEYVEGQVMPGLTLDGVLQELSSTTIKE